MGKDSCRALVLKLILTNLFAFLQLDLQSPDSRGQEIVPFLGIHQESFHFPLIRFPRHFEAASALISGIDYLLPEQLNESALSDQL